MPLCPQTRVRWRFPVSLGQCDPNESWLWALIQRKTAVGSKWLRQVCTLLRVIHPKCPKLPKWAVLLKACWSFQAYSHGNANANEVKWNRRPRLMRKGENNAKRNYLFSYRCFVGFSVTLLEHGLKMRLENKNKMYLSVINNLFTTGKHPPPFVCLFMYFMYLYCLSPWTHIVAGFKKYHINKI